MSTWCSTVRCNEELDTIVGTSTSCSASCVSRHKRRRATSRGKIFGTSITGSATTSNCAAKELDDIRQLFSHLQHRKEHRDSGRFRTRCRRAAAASPAARAPTVPLAGPPWWACHRPRKVHSTRQDPPRCWCQASVTVRRRSRRPHWSANGGSP